MNYFCFILINLTLISLPSFFLCHFYFDNKPLKLFFLIIGNYVITGLSD